MSLYINTTGQPTLNIAVCSRCWTKRKASDLTSDGNVPGLLVCLRDLSPGCWDEFDPMRLPPPPPDRITPPFVRPDTPLATPADEQGPIEPPPQYD